MLPGRPLDTNHSEHFRFLLRSPTRQIFFSTFYSRRFVSRWRLFFKFFLRAMSLKSLKVEAEVVITGSQPVVRKPPAFRKVKKRVRKNNYVMA